MGQTTKQLNRTEESSHQSLILTCNANNHKDCINVYIIHWVLGQNWKKPDDFDKQKHVSPCVTACVPVFHISLCDGPLVYRIFQGLPTVSVQCSWPFLKWFRETTTTQSFSPCFSRCPQHTHSASPMNSDWISFPFKLLATSSIFSIIVSVQLLYFKIALLLVFLIIKIVTQSIMRILSFLSSHQGPTIALLPNIFFLFSSQHRTSSHPQPSNPGSSLMAVTPPHLHTNDFQATCLALVCRFPSTNNSLATFTAPFKCTSHINRHGSFYIGLTFLKN